MLLARTNHHDDFRPWVVLQCKLRGVAEVYSEAVGQGEHGSMDSDRPASLALCADILPIFFFNRVSCGLHILTLKTFPTSLVCLLC